MKWIFAMLLSAVATAQTDDHMRFRYVPNEGGEILACTHKRIRDLPDWEVRCGEKRFAAHVVVREYRRDVEPRTSFEILYWVTDRTGQAPEFHSGTSWVRLKKYADLHSLGLSQGVENDYASLELDWSPAGSSSGR